MHRNRSIVSVALMLVIALSFFVFNVGSGTVSSAIPPQMYWNSPPNGSTNNGGSLYSCDYDSTTNSCTIGS